MDPIADFLVAIKNGYMAKKTEIVVPFSKFKLEIAKVLEKEKFTGKVEKVDQKPSGPMIKIELLYQNQKPKVAHLKRVSKLGVRVYASSKNIKSVKGGKGIFIISTPKGVMTGKVARMKNLGGEIICEVW